MTDARPQVACLPAGRPPLWVLERTVWLAGKTCGSGGGSRTDRKLLKRAINSKETISIKDASGSGGHETMDNDILYDGLFQHAIKPSAGVTDASTFGPALNFFHELTHTVAMGEKLDPKNFMALGPPDRIGNRIHVNLVYKNGLHMALNYCVPDPTGKMLPIMFRSARPLE